MVKTALELEIVLTGLTLKRPSSIIMSSCLQQGKVDYIEYEIIENLTLKNGFNVGNLKLIKI